MFPDYPRNAYTSSDLSTNFTIIFEVAVLLVQPQPNWSLLFKVRDTLYNPYYEVIKNIIKVVYKVELLVCVKHNARQHIVSL